MHRTRFIHIQAFSLFAVSLGQSWANAFTSSCADICCPLLSITVNALHRSNRYKPTWDTNDRHFKLFHTLVFPTSTCRVLSCTNGDYFLLHNLGLPDKKERDTQRAAGVNLSASHVHPHQNHRTDIWEINIFALREAEQVCLHLLSGFLVAPSSFCLARWPPSIPSHNQD